MTWQLWIVIAFIALNSFAVILSIGRPRVPITPGVAAYIIAINAATVALIVWGAS